MKTIYFVIAFLLAFPSIGLAVSPWRVRSKDRPYETRLYKVETHVDKNNCKTISEITEYGYFTTITGCLELKERVVLHFQDDLYNGKVRNIFTCIKTENYDEVVSKLTLCDQEKEE